MGKEVCNNVFSIDRAHLLHFNSLTAAFFAIVRKYANFQHREYTDCALVFLYSIEKNRMRIYYVAKCTRIHHYIFFLFTQNTVHFLSLGLSVSLTTEKEKQLRLTYLLVSSVLAAVTNEIWLLNRLNTKIKAVFTIFADKFHCPFMVDTPLLANKLETRFMRFMQYTNTEVMDEIKIHTTIKNCLENKFREKERTQSKTRPIRLANTLQLKTLNGIGVGQNAVARTNVARWLTGWLAVVR